MQRHQPSHINFVANIDAFRQGKILKLSVSQAEALVATRRNIPHFTWREDFSSQDFADFSNAAYVNHLINTDDLALCYFGEDVGYAPIALRAIPKGKILVFTGEVVSMAALGDEPDPYYATIPQGHVVNAKYTSGFASMFMDLPTCTEERKVVHRCAKQNLTKPVIQTENLDYLFVSITTSGKQGGIVKTTRDIQPGEILGSGYKETTRVLYKEFIGFDKAGNRLSPAVTEILNEVIYSELLGVYLLRSQFHFHKILKNIKKQKFRSAVKYLSADESNGALLTRAEAQSLYPFLPKRGKEKLMQLSCQLDRACRSTQLKFIAVAKRMVDEQIMARGNTARTIQCSGQRFFFADYPKAKQDLTLLTQLARELNDAVMVEIFETTLGFFSDRSKPPLITEPSWNNSPTL